MKSVITVIAVGSLAILAGCERGSSGGPGATGPSESPGMMSQAEDTFSLDVPSIKLTQGGTETVTIGIRRGQNFGQDVSLKFGEMPEGISLATANPRIMHGDSEIPISLQAADDAALGDFTVTVTAEPATGTAATGELSITIEEYVSDVSPGSASADALEEWNRDTLAMESELSRLEAERTALIKRMQEAEGQTRTDLAEQADQLKTDHEKLKVAIAERKAEGKRTWENILEDMRNESDGN